MALTVAEGRDTYCLDELRPGRWATGTLLVAQRLYHRLITPRGALLGGEDEANFGVDLAGFVGSTEGSTLDSRLPGVIRNELLKDPAVESVDVRAERTTDAGRTSWTIEIEAVTTEGTVELIVAVSDVSVDLLRVS